MAIKDRAMALTDFFRVNMPYGMERNDKGEWFVFNREYKPLGWNTQGNIKREILPVWVKYKGLSEAKLLKLAAKGSHTIRRDENGKIFLLWFYNDATNPKDSPRLWDDYFARIKILSTLKVHDSSIEKSRGELPELMCK